LLRGVSRRQLLLLLLLLAGMLLGKRVLLVMAWALVVAQVRGFAHRARGI
jgi:hypothetical protein